MNQKNRTLSLFVPTRKGLFVARRKMSALIGLSAVL